RDAGRGQHVAVVDPASLALPEHARSLLSHPVPRDLVRRRGAAVEEAGAGEQRRAGADGRGDARPAAGLGEALEKWLVGDGRPRAEPAGDQEDVVVRRLLEASLGPGRGALAGFDLPRLARLREDLEERASLAVGLHDAAGGKRLR